MSAAREPLNYLPQFVPSEKAKLAGIEAAEKAANTPGWGLDGIPKAMVDAMCVAAIRAAYATDRPNWGGLPVGPREPSSKAIEAASDVLRMPAKSYWAVGEDMIRPPRHDVGRALRAAYAVDFVGVSSLRAPQSGPSELLLDLSQMCYDEEWDTLAAMDGKSLRAALTMLAKAQANGDA